MTKIFIISFGCVAFFYAIISAFSSILYKSKSRADLSLLEIKILRNEATIADRLLTFLINFMSSIIAPPVYILAGVFTLIAYFLF